MFLLSGAIIISLSSCAHKHENDELAHRHHHNHEAEHHHSDEHDDNEDHSKTESEITLDPEMAERFGVETEAVSIMPFEDIIKVSGEILNSPSESAVIVAPVSGTVNFHKSIQQGLSISAGKVIATINSSNVAGANSNLAAKATYEAAKREYERLKPLYDEKLITISEYNSALQAYEEAKANYSSAANSGIASSPISGIITSIDVSQGQYVEAGTPIAQVSSSKTLTLRADLPQRYHSQEYSIKDATISIPYSDKVLTVSALDGNRISSSGQTTSVSKGYIPVYFSFRNDGSLIPGTNVDVYLIGNSVSDALTVPVTALSEQQGLYYVFIRLDEDCYRKSLVRTGRSNGSRIEILSGLNPGENVVTKGTTTVRIAESSGVIPEGHTHNH